MNEERKKGSSDLLNLRSWRKIKMVVSFRSVSLVNTKLRIEGANFLGEAVSLKTHATTTKHHSSLQVY